MKKKILKTTLLVVLVMFAGYNVYSSQQFEVISEIGLANVEALANDENNGIGNCNNHSGYRKWDLEESLLYPKKKQFYDCCYVLQTGYHPTGSCI